MRAEFNRQQEQAMLQAAQQPIPASFLEGVQANRAAMDAVHQLWQADDVSTICSGLELFCTWWQGFCVLDA